MISGVDVQSEKKQCGQENFDSGPVRPIMSVLTC